MKWPVCAGLDAFVDDRRLAQDHPMIPEDPPGAAVHVAQDMTC